MTETSSWDRTQVDALFDESRFLPTANSHHASSSSSSSSSPQTRLDDIERQLCGKRKRAAPTNTLFASTYRPRPSAASGAAAPTPTPAPAAPGPIRSKTRPRPATYADTQPTQEFTTAPAPTMQQQQQQPVTFMAAVLPTQPDSDLVEYHKRQLERRRKRAEDAAAAAAAAAAASAARVAAAQEAPPKTVQESISVDVFTPKTKNCTGEPIVLTIKGDDRISLRWVAEVRVHASYGTTETYPLEQVTTSPENPTANLMIPDLLPWRKVEKDCQLYLCFYDAAYTIYEPIHILVTYNYHPLTQAAMDTSSSAFPPRVLHPTRDVMIRKAPPALPPSKFAVRWQ